jgi:VPDSG-CTERM motif
MKFPMKLKMISSNRLAVLSAAFCAVMLAFSHNASALAFGDANDLGKVLFGIPSGDDARTQYVNTLISLAPGTTNFPADGQHYTRSLANPGPGFPNYPDAVFALNGTGTSIDLGNGSLYSYLFAKYDGRNAGSEVWYVGGLSGIITIPAVGLAGQNYGLSGWTLFGPGVPGVPDGGTTVMLLGAALGALGIARRYIMS